MCLGEFHQGIQVNRDTYRYTHVVPPKQRKNKYHLYVQALRPLDAPYDHVFPHLKAVLLRWYRPETLAQAEAETFPEIPSCGTVEGCLRHSDSGLELEPHSYLGERHRGLGLGIAMYEALYRHALTLGVVRIRQECGCSVAASGVHKALAEKHNLTYRAILPPKRSSYTVDYSPGVYYSYPLVME
jgi:GNAT superfamily N-acetyltransferase